MSEQATATRVVPSRPLVVKAVLRTHVGRVRSENQDFAALTTPEEERDTRPGGRLMIVADGMGGHRGGATASRLAADTVKENYLAAGSDDVPTVLRDALTRANARIFAEAQTTLDLRGMGTTTSALVVRGNQAWLAHVGDSRIYLVRGDDIRQLTEDHSLVASMVREGLLTQKEAESHPRRNVLQRSIGVAEEVEVDVLGPLDVLELDTYVVCSDGLHGVVAPKEIKDIALGKSIDEAADALVNLALERGAPDNVTVIVARVEREDADEDTLVDHDHDPAAFDETIKEKSEASPSPGPSLRSGPPSPEGRGPAQEPRRRTSSVIKWALLFVLGLGAAGAWLFLSQQQMFQSQKTSSSR